MFILKFSVFCSAYFLIECYCGCCFFFLQRKKLTIQQLKNDFCLFRNVYLNTVFIFFASINSLSFPSLQYQFHIYNKNETHIKKTLQLYIFVIRNIKNSRCLYIFHLFRSLFQFNTNIQIYITYMIDWLNLNTSIQS